jgi:hypothetical protein
MRHNKFPTLIVTGCVAALLLHWPAYARTMLVCSGPSRSVELRVPPSRNRDFRMHVKRYAIAHRYIYIEREESNSRIQIITIREPYRFSIVVNTSSTREMAELSVQDKTPCNESLPSEIRSPFQHLLSYLSDAGYR